MTAPIRPAETPTQRASLNGDAGEENDLGREPDPVIEAYKKDIDRSLIRENLSLTPQQRFDRLMELQRFARELSRAGRGCLEGADAIGSSRRREAHERGL